ncbi:hypothetical protein [Halorubrum aidingense]|uniref:hypothetical protein n=1 Tax=Halorubrum aidingense TaxID=368623 RepID=UPI00126779FE|nr:hypothetical protein [Halorubrum aidingense]
MDWDDPTRTESLESVDEHVRREEARAERHYEQQGIVRDLVHEIEKHRLCNIASADEDVSEQTELTAF